MTNTYSSTPCYILVIFHLLIISFLIYLLPQKFSSQINKSSQRGHYLPTIFSFDWHVVLCFRYKRKNGLREEGQERQEKTIHASICSKAITTAQTSRKQQRGQVAQQLIKQLDQGEKGGRHKKEHKHHSLFKLNMDSSAIISEVPVDILRRRSKSQKLESLESEQKEAFSLLEHHRETQDKHIKQKNNNLKKYDIDLRQLTEAKQIPLQKMEPEQEEEKFEIVRPSQSYRNISNKEDSFFQPMLFQTPILPCFSSEFQPRQDGGSKTIREGEGVWRVGKMKVKGEKCQLRVGEFVFEGRRSAAEGKAGVLSGSNLMLLPNWREMCILQPQQSLFQ